VSHKYSDTCRCDGCNRIWLKAVFKRIKVSSKKKGKK